MSKTITVLFIGGPKDGDVLAVEIRPFFKAISHKNMQEVVYRAPLPQFSWLKRLWRRLCGKRTTPDYPSPAITITTTTYNLEFWHFPAISQRIPFYVHEDLDPACDYVKYKVIDYVAKQNY